MAASKKGPQENLPHLLSVLTRKGERSITLLNIHLCAPNSEKFEMVFLRRLIASPPLPRPEGRGYKQFRLIASCLEQRLNTVAL